MFLSIAPFDHWCYLPDYLESLAVPFIACLTNTTAYCLYLLVNTRPRFQ